MPSSNQKTQTQRREPLRWLALGVILLAFIAICCTSQIITYVVTPRNLASQLLLLSLNSADYSPWGDGPLLPALGPEIPEALAAERSTAELALTVTPTPVLVGAVPTGIVAIVPPPPDAPEPTPAGVRIVLVPTPTPTVEQPAAGGANTPIPTVRPSQPNNPVPTDMPVPPTATTDTVDRPQPTTTPDIPATSPPDSGGGATPGPTAQPPAEQPTRITPRPRTPQPTAVSTAQPPTEEPTRPRPQPRPPQPTATFTPEPPPPTATFTPRPVQPTATFTPRPVQPTATPRPPTPRPTATFTPMPTATFTPVPTPTEAPQEPVISKDLSPNSPNFDEIVTYTIRVENNTSAPMTVARVTDVTDPTFSLIDCIVKVEGVPVDTCSGSPQIIWDGSQILQVGETLTVEIIGEFVSTFVDPPPPDTYRACNSDYQVTVQGLSTQPRGEPVCVDIPVPEPPN
ncbi:MAG: hypothetical protein GFH27_549309n165 [Chloroflexi bacterium AL-W]|nr:hypothetical protein [Chloroflexi bacterium AL-N1]NOK68189.1 hypothetical protein [Chloroflexi bacterium AL-N10]NOK73529.1 hypothetical protein [Chloroflexi bacterium AL-N5]NOK84037.1 hypothetical protein [Chloroflexi bacterium AL-W]NOK87860.1 hypothetical protein [Chloroflexi bacterium AL-N15]